MLTILKQTLYYELVWLKRYRALWIQPVLFFIIMLSLFGIGLGLDEGMLAEVSPAVIWITFLLTSLLTVDTLIRIDQEEGTLEQLVLSRYPLWWLLLSKSCAVWLISCVPLICLIPLIGLAMHLTLDETAILFITLLVGSPALSFIGVLGATLTVTLPRAGLLLALLLLPLYLPVLILGESALELTIGQPWPLFQTSLLLAFSILSITLAPLAASAALKASMDE
jgi:heme exporter protein B